MEETNTEAENPEKPSGWKRLGKWVLYLTGGWAFLWYGLPWFFPVPSALKIPPESSLVITDRTGVPLHSLLRQDFQRHRWTPLAEIPPSFREATMAAEDKRFYSHGGADFLALIRAVKDGIEERRVVSGASTITQQLVKVSLPPRRRNLAAKLREFFTARKLEMMWSKDKILEEYLNRVSYGNLCIGCGTASQWYFQKDMKDLSLAETALLAGLPQAPSRHNPLKNRASAKRRQHWVLERMGEVFGYDATRLKAAAEEPWRFRPADTPKIAPHLVDWISQRHRKDWDREPEVRTTIDLRMQSELEMIVRRETDRLKGKNVEQAAALVIDNRTGDVLAWVGSSSYDSKRGGQINGALAPRSAGSTLKPFTYMLAFERAGYDPGTVIPDVPTEFRSDFGIDAPENFDRVFRGPVTAREALATSMNIPAMRVLQDAGGAPVLVARLRELHMNGVDRKPEEYGLGLTIGNAEVSLLELTSAYACMARLGQWREPRLLADEELKPPKRLLPADSCFLVADILKDNFARFRAFGLGSPLRLPFPAAAKTGTSTNFRDNWCVGFTSEFTVGVWVGNFSGSPMRGVTGVDGAGPIFHAAMLMAHERTPATWHSVPEGVARVRRDDRTGKAVPADWPDNPHYREEWIFTRRPPACAAAEDYDGKGRVMLDERYRRWYQTAGPEGTKEYVLADMKTLPLLIPARIYEPAEGATYQIDPDLPGSGRRLNLRSNLDKTANWSSDSLSVRQRDGAAWVELQPGRHSVEVVDPESGRKAVSHFQVKAL